MIISIAFFSFFLGLAASRALPRADSCDCTGTRNDPSTGTAYICGDSRLGPTVLPEKLPLGTLVASYDRFGGLTPSDFLAKWTDAEGNYKYPPQNGFQLDANGAAINGTMVLEPGTLVDRFGSEFGAYLPGSAYVLFLVLTRLF